MVSVVMEWSKAALMVALAAWVWAYVLVCCIEWVRELNDY
jgi:hypothetical protein